ncbi:hypothetical protein BKA69DRAFT_1166260 [Paraphysoderma sedebokerense]|nr:hypothetical protein BKA69DRAFT_1166260 [Paraphysoderma sedebokerense]
MKLYTISLIALFVAGSQASMSNGNRGSQRTPATPPPTAGSYGGVTPEVRAHVDLVNQYRATHGLGPNRAKAYGYGSAAAENVAMNIIAPNAEQQKKCRDPVGNYFPKIRDTVESAKYASCQLYNSEGHRVNMLKPDVNQIGYGFATNGRDSYHTEMYGKSDQPCVGNYSPTEQYRQKASGAYGKY